MEVQKLLGAIKRGAVVLPPLSFMRQCLNKRRCKGNNVKQKVVGVAKLAARAR
jgi:hypothetical protein